MTATNPKQRKIPPYQQCRLATHLDDATGGTGSRGQQGDRSDVSYLIARLHAFMAIISCARHLAEVEDFACGLGIDVGPAWMFMEFTPELRRELQPSVVALYHLVSRPDLWSPWFQLDDDISLYGTMETLIQLSACLELRTNDAAEDLVRIASFPHKDIAAVALPAACRAHHADVVLIDDILNDLDGAALDRSCWSNRSVDIGAWATAHGAEWMFRRHMHRLCMDQRHLFFEDLLDSEDDLP